MKITEINHISSPQEIKKAIKKKNASGGDFSNLISNANIDSTEGAEFITSQGSLLADFGLGRFNDEQFLIDNAGNLLKDLHLLRLEIISGRIEKTLLSTLKQDITSIKTNNFIPPKLQEILHDLELTASVEIAKLER
jgi:hypothetical protein